MKEEFKAVKRHKFRTWRRAFAVFFALFILSFILGALLSGEDFLVRYTSRLVSRFSLDYFEIFRTLLLSLIPFFLLFVFGPTIYAPVLSGTTVILTGLFGGAELSYLFKIGRWGAALFEAILSGAVSYLIILYAAMVTLSALRIFTDKKTDSKNEIFEGSLFCAAGFRGIFNYRYVLTYIGFYIFISLVAVGVTLLRALAVMLV